MTTREDRIAELVERAHNYRSTPLYDFIMKEHLQKYRLGYEDILYADSLNVAIVPCLGYMILARERYDKASKQTVAEYAIYSEHDDDGRPLYNSLNANAEYILETVGEETFSNMAFAIAYAANLIDKVTECDDPVDIVSSVTDDDIDRNLTEDDAIRLIQKAKDMGFNVPFDLTPDYFISLYNEMKPGKGMKK